MCLCTEPPASVMDLFGGKLRRWRKWSHGSDTVEYPLIPLQYTFPPHLQQHFCPWQSPPAGNHVIEFDCRTGNTNITLLMFRRVCGNLRRRIVTSLSSTAVHFMSARISNSIHTAEQRRMSSSFLLVCPSEIAKVSFNSPPICVPL